MRARPSTLAVLAGLLPWTAGAADARPRHDRCAVPREATFESVDLLDGGLSPEGPVRGRWTLRLEGDAYRWTWSDVSEGGPVRCRDRRLDARGPAGRRSGRYDPRTGFLRWEGRLYRPVAGVGTPRAPVEPPAEEPPPPSPPPPAPPPDRGPADHRIPPLGRDDAERRACASHADCVVSCDVDGDCCRQSCGCGNPLNRAFAGRLRAHLESNCRGRHASCPAVACAMRMPGTALCREGRCVHVEGPGGAW